jgi:hypothetical protein
MNDVVKLAIDLHKGSLGNYSKEQANETLRSALIEANGGSDKITPKSFRNNPQIFQILEEALDVLVVEGLEDQFDEFVEIRNLNWGDTNVFTSEDTKLFNVAVVADGNGNLRKQRLDNGELTVKTKTRAVAIYEELHRLMAGRIDWSKMVERVAKSYNNKIKTEIYDAIYNSYDGLTAPYQVTGTFAEADLSTLIAHVEAGTGQDAVIYGTKAALGKVSTAQISDNMKDVRNQLGYYGVFNGTEMLEIRQAHKAGTNDFAINDSFLLVVPRTPDKMIKLVLEGESLIQETPFGENADMSGEYTFIKKSGVGVMAASKYGIYRLS